MIRSAMVLVLVASSVAAAGALEIRDGDRIRGVLAADGDSRELVLPAAAGTNLRVRLRGEGSLVLLDPGGRPMAVSERYRAGRARLEVAAMPVTGAYRLLLTGEGEVALKIRARAPGKVRVEGHVAGGEAARIDFGAVAGSRLDVKLRGTEGLLPDLPMAEIPGDGDVPLRATLLGSRVRISGINVPDLGDGTIVVTARDDAGGGFRGTVRVRGPRERREVVLPEPVGDERRPGGERLVLSRDTARLDDDVFALRVRGARVNRLMGRGPAGEERERVDVVVEMETESGALVAWILLRLWRPADLAPGRIALDDPRVEMLHVVTNFRGLLYSTVVPEISGPRAGALTLFRAAPEEGRDVEGVIDGVVQRAADERRIEFRDLPIEAVVEEIRVRGVI